ncbi:MAG TPA: hypothetical protein VFV10_17040 [Gammaproteobacteria bacterium]|nr:hypothetical protein [Gammaproteobacteria bacterium]
MKFRNGLGASLFAILLSAVAAGAQAPATPATTDIPEFIVLAKAPPSTAADARSAASAQAAPTIDPSTFDAASAVKALQAEQEKALMADIEPMPVDWTSR